MMYFIEVDNGKNGEEAAHLIIYVSRPCECSKHAISAANSIRPPENNNHTCHSTNCDAIIVSLNVSEYA